MSTPNHPKKKQSRSPKRVWCYGACKTSILQSRNPAHTSISPLSYKQRCPHLASLQGTSQHFHFSLSCFASAIGGRQLATQRFHLPAEGMGMRMPKNAENPSVYKQCVSHILSARSMEMYGSFTVLGRTWNKTNQVISSNLTWKVLRLLPKIRNLSQYVPAALAALLVPDG